MSHNSVHVADGKAGSPPNTSDIHAPIGDDLTPEMKNSVITRAKEIMACRICPPSMAVPPEVERFLQREFSGCNPPPTPEAIRRISEDLSLQAHYRGIPIACFTTAEGYLTVLASGESEIFALLKGLSHEEGAKILVTDT